MDLREMLESLERPVVPPSLWTDIRRGLDVDSRPVIRRTTGFRLVLAVAVLLIASAAGVWRLRRGGPARIVGAEPSAFVLSAVDLHRERLEGALGFEECDRSADDIRAWVCRSSGLDAPSEQSDVKGLTRHLACAAIVEAGGARAAVFAYEDGSRPVTLVTARRSELSSGSNSRAWFSRVRVYRDAARGVTLRSWADTEQAYVLVASSRTVD